MFLTMFAAQVPILIVCIIACAVILLRWNEAAHGAFWALIGFGLSLLLCFAVPLTQVVVQQWMAQNGGTANRFWVFTCMGILWSILRAVSYACLLVAVFAGRSAPDAMPPSPFDRAGAGQDV